MNRFFFETGQTILDHLMRSCCRANNVRTAANRWTWPVIMSSRRFTDLIENPPMTSLFSDLTPEFRFTLLLVSSVLTAAFAVVGLFVWARVRRLQIEADLKTDMLERGLTPEEICQILSTPMRGK